MSMFPADPTDHVSRAAGTAMWTGHVPAARFAAAITTGYILYDTALGLVVPGTLDRAMWVHHFIVIFCYGGGLILGCGIPFMSLFLINEASTPFVNIHFVMKAAWEGNWKKGVNGLGMWLSYLFCRLIANTLVGYSMFATCSPEVWAKHPFLLVLNVTLFCVAQCE